MIDAWKAILGGLLLVHEVLNVCTRMYEKGNEEEEEQCMMLERLCRDGCKGPTDGGKETFDNACGWWVRMVAVGDGEAMCIRLVSAA